MRCSTAKILSLAGAVWLLGVSPVLADDASGQLSEVLVKRLLPELGGLFVVATIMESALTTLFNWRLYREFFNGRACKTLVMIGVGYFIVSGFSYDIVSRVIHEAGGTTNSPLVSTLLSTLVLAGGSSAVFELFKRLGLRPPAVQPAPATQPGEGKAWVSVRIDPVSPGLGPVSVFFEKIEDPTPQEQASPPLCGVLGKRPFLKRLLGIFLADPLRFPPSGGRTVDALSVYRITVQAKQYNPMDPETTNCVLKQTVFVGRFAQRAVVDFVYRLSARSQEDEK